MGTARALPSLPPPQNFFDLDRPGSDIRLDGMAMRSNSYHDINQGCGWDRWGAKGMSEGRQRRAGAGDMSDVELVNQLVAGKRAAFPVFYHRYARLIRHCITKRTHLEADDLMQDFFVKLQASNFKALDHWNRVTPLTNYLSLVIKNFVIDAYRGQGGRRGPRQRNPIDTLRDWMRRVILGGGRSGEDDAGDDDEEQVSDWHASPDTRLERLELRKQGIKAWSRLSSPRDRRLICGKFHRDTPADQAALAEGLSPGTFRKAIFDAQKRYMTVMRDVAPEFFA